MRPTASSLGDEAAAGRSLGRTTQAALRRRLRSSRAEVTQHRRLRRLRRARGDPGIGGLIHVSGVSWTKKPSTPARSPPRPARRSGFEVLEVDASKRRISLGLKQTLQNPWESFAEKHRVGSIVEGEVKNKTKFEAIHQPRRRCRAAWSISDLDWSRPGERRRSRTTRRRHGQSQGARRRCRARSASPSASSNWPMTRLRGQEHRRRGRRGRTAQGLGRDLRGRRGQGRRSSR